MKYLPLLDLRLTHAYFTDGYCRDLRVAPTPSTEAMLRNFRCVLRTRPDGAQVLAPVTDQNARFITLPTDMVLTFELYIQNADFALYTDLSAITAAPVFTNANLPPAPSVTLELISRLESFTEQLAVQQPGAASTFTLSGRPADNILASDFVITGFTGSVTQYDPAAKIITINTQNAQPGGSFTVTYPIIPALGRGVFSGVEIHVDPSDVAVTHQYNIHFAAKHARWAYYLVTDTAGTFQITDGDSTPIVFLGANPPEPDDRVGATLAQQYPDKQRLRFTSNAPVSFRQTARKALQLRLDDSSVIEALPNPALNNYSFVQIDSHKEEALFQIVKYFSTNFR